ncbi:MAG: hypothetical protein KDK99_05080 [Verrucomicrobiales bacterium]|nr:hypothetical protein [Verrucomicrobiales bacterium]
MRRALGCLIALGHAGLLAAQGPAEVALTWGPRHAVEWKQDGGGVDLTLREGNPHVWTGKVGAEFDPERHTVLALEYFCPAGVESVAVRFRGREGMVLAGSAPMPLAEAWQPFALDLAQAPERADPAVEDFRFHLAFKGRPGTQVKLRGLRLREPTAEERQGAAERERVRAQRGAEAEACLAYLKTEFPAQIETVHVGLHEITLTGKADRQAGLIGIEPQVPMDQTGTGGWSAGTVKRNADGAWTMRVPRRAGRGGDRALWRWRLVDEQGAAISACRWPTVEGPAVGRRTLERLRVANRKGLGGVTRLEDGPHEIFDLGIGHATVNIVVTGVLHEAPRPGTQPWAFEGRTYHVHERMLELLDATVRPLSQRGIIVSGILLVGNHRDGEGRPVSSMTHPEAEARGIFAMPNLTSRDSTAFYRAVIHLLAERYTRADGANGRISNWILHNEIDQAGAWTNMGDQPLARYLETYLRSARIVHHTARLFDPHARVFVSLTHHWTRQSSGVGTYVVRDMIDLFADMARVEGDFEWGIAYHPYPQDLRNPDTWKDADVSDDFDTPYITPKNLQVLPRYLAQERLLYRGKPRGILLSEQGFNTPTLRLQDQQRQVAAMIYTFRKLRKLPEIEAFHLHRYQDMPEGEGGLRLGIVTETGEHKLGWWCYKALGTEEEAEYAEMADEVMGDEE